MIKLKTARVKSVINEIEITMNNPFSYQKKLICTTCFFLLVKTKFFFSLLFFSLFNFYYSSIGKTN